MWLHRALIWVFKTASGRVKIASKVEGKISVHHCLLLHAQHRDQCYLLFYWHSALIKTKVVILTSFVAHWRAPEAGRRNVWSLLDAAKYCRVAKLRPHWRCDLIDKFCQLLCLIKTVLSLVRIGPNRRNVWSLLGAAKFCRVAKLRPHWRCDLIDKFCQALRLIKTDLSLVRIGPMLKGQLPFCSLPCEWAAAGRVKLSLTLANFLLITIPFTNPWRLYNPVLGKRLGGHAFETTKRLSLYSNIAYAGALRTFTSKISHVQIFLKLWLQVENDKIRLKTLKKNRRSPNSIWRQTIAFLGFLVSRGDTGRIHYFRHMFKLKNHIYVMCVYHSIYRPIW